MTRILARLAAAALSLVSVAAASPAHAGPGGGIFDGFAPADTLNGIVYESQPITVGGATKVIVGGAFTDAGSAANDYLTILNADGSVYSGFTPAGALNGPVSSIQPITVGGEQKYLIGGAFTDLGAADNDRVAILNSDGSTYTGFNPGARLNSTVSSVAAFSVGGVHKIAVGGDFSNAGGTRNNRVVLLHANGTVDTTFAPLSSINGVVRSIAPMTIGGEVKFLLGGDFVNAGGSNDALVILNSSGSAYTPFAPGDAIGGVVTSAEPVGVGGHVKYLVTGDFSDLGAARNGRLAILNADGSVFSGFSPGALLNSTAYDAMPTTIDGTRKYVVAGSFTDVGGDANDYLAVLNADGSPYPGFSVGSTFNFAVLDVSATSLEDEPQYLTSGLFSNVGTPDNDLVTLVDAPVITRPLAVRQLRMVGAPRANDFTARWAVPAGTTVTQPVAFYRLTVQTAGRVILDARVPPQRTSLTIPRSRLVAGLPPGRHSFALRVNASNSAGGGPAAVARFIAVR
jgi:hypothetical protein